MTKREAGKKNYGVWMNVDGKVGDAPSPLDRRQGNRDQGDKPLL